MKNKNLLHLALLSCLMTNSCNNAFKKAYSNYNKHDFAAAKTAFETYREHPKLAAAAQFFLAKIKLSDTRELPGLLELNQSLLVTDSLFRNLPPRQARRQTRRYELDTLAIADLHEQTQRWAIAWTRVQSTLPALDALLEGLPQPLPQLQPDMENTRQDIVNAHLETADYDTMTAILRRHIRYVLPENYEHTRRMNEQLWPAFMEKYSACAIGRFAIEHPLSFAGRDCWRNALQPLLCTGTLGDLLNFHANNRWTALEIVLLNRIADLSGTSADLTGLSPALQQQLDDLKARTALRSRLTSSNSASDTLEVLEQAQAYISRYAPRYSAFRLMEESLQFFLNGRHYHSAVELLERARPFFPDTLPYGCNTNFDFQLRVKPWIDGKLPLLRRPEPRVTQWQLSALNSPEGAAYHPVLCTDGQEIYFAGKNRPGNIAGADVFVAHWDSVAQDWSAPNLVPELSGPGQQAPLSISADGLQLLLFWNTRLYLSRRSNQESAWSQPELLPVSGIPVIGKGFLSADGNTLVLEGSYSAGSATQAPDLDLFVSFRDSDSGVWSRPTALGADINTDGQEANPFLSPDGQSLYYTSTGYPGLGSSDIFLARRTKDDWTHWTRPYNLGKELNDTYPHTGFHSVSPDGKKAWLSKNGALWEIDLPE